MAAQARMQQVARDERQNSRPKPDPLLHHYIRFVLPREGGPLRERLLRALVERGLKTSNREHLMTVADLEVRIARLTGLPSYPRDVVLYALASLATRGDVDRSRRSRRGEMLYRLSDRRFEELERAGRESTEEEEQLRAQVVQRISEQHGNLDDDDAQVVEQAFVDFLARMLTAFGNQSASRLVSHGCLSQFDDYPGAREELDRAVRGLPREVQITARRCFIELLTSPPPEIKNYLFSAGQAYYIVGLLALDPELQALQRGRFEDTTLYFDTNLLVALVLPENETHDASLALTRLCGSLGFRMRFSRRTAEEFEDLISSAARDYAHYPPFDLESASHLAGLVDNPFLRAWLASWSEHRASWDQFMARIAAWQSILDHLGVEPAHECDDVSVSEARVGQVRERLKTAPRVVAPQRSADRRPRLPKAAEHDARMVVGLEALIDTDDSQPHPFGNRYWFVTLDRSLVKSLRQVDGLARSICMLADEWVQYIGPFIGPDVSADERADVFSTLLASRFFMSIGSTLSLKELQPFTAPNVSTLMEGLSDEEMCGAVAQAHARAVATSDSPDTATEIGRLLAVVDKQLDRKVQRGELVPSEDVARLTAEASFAQRTLKDVLSERDGEISRLRSDLADARKYRKTSLRYWVAAVAAVGFNIAGAVTRWVRFHPIRTAVTLSIVVAIAVAARAGGWQLAVLLTALGVVLTASPRNVRENLAGWLGRGKEDRDD